MKIKLALLLTLAFVPFIAFAQDVPPAAEPISVSTILLVVIPLLTPIVIRLAALVIPKLPSWLLPILAPAIGALIDFLSSLAGGPTVGPVLGAALGAAGTGLREIQDQVRRKASDVAKVG